MRPAPHGPSGRAARPRVKLILLALAGVVAAVCALTACAATVVNGTGTVSSGAADQSVSAARSIASPTLPPTPTTTPSATGAPVHVSSLESDGATYGVGMPIVVYFDQKITDASAFIKAATVTVNGADEDGAWYFEVSARSGEVIEAHYRPQTYWPGHAKIHVGLPLAGLSAGAGLVYNDSLTLDFSTGVANILTVDGNTHMLTVMSDGSLYGTYPGLAGRGQDADAARDEGDLGEGPRRAHDRLGLRRGRAVVDAAHRER